MRVIGQTSLLTKSRHGSTIQLIILDKRIPKRMKRTLRWINLQVMLKTPQAAIILLGLVTKGLPKLPNVYLMTPPPRGRCSEEERVGVVAAPP
jgi:hypothetical protein